LAEHVSANAGKQPFDQPIKLRALRAQLRKSLRPVDIDAQGREETWRSERPTAISCLLKLCDLASAFDEAWRVASKKMSGARFSRHRGRNRIVRAADSRTIA